MPGLRAQGKTILKINEKTHHWRYWNLALTGAEQHSFNAVDLLCSLCKAYQVCIMDQHQNLWIGQTMGLANIGRM